MRPGRNGGKLKTGGVNPGAGRPKLLPIDEMLAEVLGEEKEGVTAVKAILMKLRSMAASGNLKASEMLLDRAYGKPKQMTDITTNGESLTGDLILKLPVEKQAQILRILDDQV